MVKRSVEEANDMAGMSRELASLSNNTVVGLMEEKEKEGRSCKEIYYSTSKEISNLNTSMMERNSELDRSVLQRVLSLLDILTAFTNMMDRHQKGVLKVTEEIVLFS